MPTFLEPLNQALFPTIDPLLGWTVIAVAIFLGSCLRGYTGFGMPIISVPLMAWVISLSHAVPLVMFLQIWAAIFALPSQGKQVDWPILRWMFVGCCVGIPLGVFALATIPDSGLKIVLGILVVVLSILMVRGWRFSHRPGRFTQGLVGVTSGLLHGGGAISGPPVALLLLAMRMPPPTMRATMAIYYGFIGVVALGTIFWQIGIPPLLPLISPLLMPFMLMGLWCGGYLFRKSSGKRFDQITLTCLIAVGIMTIIAGITTWR